MKISFSNLVNVIVLVALLFSLLFVSSTSSVGVYDPWLDTNDDGVIDMRDIGAVARGFGASGEPFDAKAAIEYDSGWINITDKAGQNIIVAHGLGSMDVMVDIMGRTTVDGGVHQKQIGGEDYTGTGNQTYGGTSSEQAYSLVQTGDGGYALAGYTWSFGAGGCDFWLVKTDAAGNVEWSQTYGGTSSEQAYSLVQTGDGGYALAGITDSYDVGGGDFWLVKTDAAGNALWNQTYGGTDDEYAYSLVQTGDGGYALAGYTWSFGAGVYDCWLVKTDASGNVLWNQTYGGPRDEYAWSLVQTVDGGYALAGVTSDFGADSYDFWLVKTDASGNVLWNQTYGGPNWDEAYSLVQTSDGGYALAGFTFSYDVGGGDSWLVKTDAAGNVEWSQTYGGTSSEQAYSLVQTGDGGYALAGYTGSYGAGGIDFWLVKTDAAGNALWNQTYGGGTSNECARSLVQTADTGYALAGFVSSGLFYDWWFVKTDSNGNMPTGLFKYGLAWIDATLDSITLHRGKYDPYWNFVRVRIWTIKTP